MNIAEKTSKISSGEDSQHGTSPTPVQERPEANVRLRSLLRGESESARAAETSYFPNSSPGGTVPAPSNQPAAPDDAQAGQATEVPWHPAAGPAPKKVAAKPTKRVAAKKVVAKKK